MTTQKLKCLTLKKPTLVYYYIRFLVIIFSIWLITLNLFFHEPIQLITNYWPITVIAFVSAIVANATAIGGGFIFLPLFSLSYALNATEALKLALSTQAFGMTSGALSWPRNLIQWHYFFLACLGSSIGMAVGTFYWFPSNEVIYSAFGNFSILLCFLLLFEALYKPLSNANTSNLPCTKIILFVLVCCLGGLITAWISIGVGEIVAVWLLLQAKLNISKSIATGVAVLAFCSILGFIFHSMSGGIPWEYLMFTAPGVILGGNVGAKLGMKLANADLTFSTHYFSAEILLKIFVALIVLFDGIFILYKYS